MSWNSTRFIAMFHLLVPVPRYLNYAGLIHLSETTLFTICNNTLPESILPYDYFLLLRFLFGKIRG